MPVIGIILILAVPPEALKHDLAVPWIGKNLAG
jgi:hypothetical protein